MSDYQFIQVILHENQDQIIREIPTGSKSVVHSLFKADNSSNSTQPNQMFVQDGLASPVSNSGVFRTSLVLLVLGVVGITLGVLYILIFGVPRL